MVFSNIPQDQNGNSGQDGGIGRNTSLPPMTKRRIITNLKTINNQNCQDSKLHGTPTTKKLKEHSCRLVGGAEMVSLVGGEDPQQGGRPCR